jgi:hypothetical protein
MLTRKISRWTNVLKVYTYFISIITRQHKIRQHNATQLTTKHSTTQDDTKQHNIRQDNTRQAEGKTRQGNATQHNTAQDSPIVSSFDHINSISILKTGNPLVVTKLLECLQGNRVLECYSKQRNANSTKQGDGEALDYDYVHKLLFRRATVQ